MNKISGILIGLASVLGLIGIGTLSESLIAVNHIIFLGLFGIVFAIALHNKLIAQTMLKNTGALWGLIVCMVFGTITTIISSNLTSDKLRDTAAILLAIILAMLVRYLYIVGNILVYVRTISILCGANLALFAIGLIIGDLPGFELWYGPRFIGFCRNPNQTAFLTIVAIFITITEIRIRKRKSGKSAISLYLILLGHFAVGYFTGSSAFRFAIIFTFLLGILLYLTIDRRSRVKPIYYWSMAIAACLGVLITAFIYTDLISPAIEETGIVRDDQQASYRFSLWKESIGHIQEYPIFGRGGGAVGGTFDLSLESQAMEAHSIYLDLLIATGLVGFCFFSAWIYSLLKHNWIRGNYWEILCILGIMLFTVFHNFLRQPLYWSIILLMGYFDVDDIKVMGTRMLRKN